MGTGEQANVEYLISEEKKGYPFSEAVRVGNMLYLSGQLGLKSRKLVPGGIVEETRQTMENIKTTLESYGSSIDHIIKATVMMADMSEWSVMNKVYVSFFSGSLPARSAFGTNGLARDARVEIEVIAVLK